jgi:hypothetical protein
MKRETGINFDKRSKQEEKAVKSTSAMEKQQKSVSKFRGFRVDICYLKRLK